MRFTRSLLVALFIVSFAGCDILNTSHNATENRELPRPLSEQELNIAEGSNNFSFQLMKTLREKEQGKNFFVSPLSISTAFGMVLNGAEGDTFDQLREFFGHSGMTRNQINEAYKGLIDLLINLDSDVIMKIANSNWVRQGFEINTDFLDDNREYFNAEVRQLDFSDPSAPDVINGWIEDNTEGLIKKMINRIDPEMVLYLINAIYFKGDWTVPFDPDKTREAPFFTADGGTIEVSMMENRDNYRYYRDETWTAVDLWYGQAGYSFTALLPTETPASGDSLPDLTAEQFSAVTSNLNEKKLTLQMPRIEIDYKIDKFKQELINMGLDLPFDRVDANLSRISKSVKTYISEVGHRAVIKLDEKGTEAAAVTTVGVEAISLNQVRLDRPFLFFIRENSTNTILFMGSYTGVSD